MAEIVRVAVESLPLVAGIAIPFSNFLKIFRP